MPNNRPKSEPPNGKPNEMGADAGNALNLTISQETLELLLKAQANAPFRLDLSQTLEMIVLEYDRSLSPEGDEDSGSSGFPLLH